MEVLEVLDSGLLTTIQDTGRAGFRQYGVPVCGALDPISSRLANYLVGNASSDALLEITLMGPRLRFLTAAAFALSGADLSPSLNRVPLKMNETQFAVKGDVLRFGRRRHGVRCYLSISGGFSGNDLLGSRATHLRSQWGGLNGAALAKGQILSSKQSTRGPQSVLRRLPPFPVFGQEVRIVPGPEFTLVESHDLTVAPWEVSTQSDRAGIRLTGRQMTSPQKEMISSPVDVGTIQLPRGGEPLILLNDGPNIGGYPRIASVLQCDLAKVAQLGPGDTLGLSWISMQESREIHADYLHALNRLDASQGYRGKTPQ
ncbi:MAG: biotin-dependent carboxyltransferase family protein [Bacteroidota bacterium]